MKMTAQDYHDAAFERLGLAYWLYEQGYYYQAHWYAGLAVECLLRAILRKHTSKWDSRHDLLALANESRLVDMIPAPAQEQFDASLNRLNTRWRSNHRYYPESAVSRYLSNLGFDHKQRGDKKKNRSRDALDAAHKVFKLGEQVWKSKNA